MSVRAPGQRVRVVIAGRIYEKRALVRRFLEDDGFDVVADVRGRPALFAALDVARPDAVVLDEGLLGEDKAADLAEIRAAALDASIVAFTDGPTTPFGADGYLQKGVGLAALTGLLNSLVTEAAPAPSATSLPGPPPPRVPQKSERRTALRLVALVAGVTLAVFTVMAVVGNVPELIRSAPESPSPSFPVQASSPLDRAKADLRDMVDALKGGDYVLASVLAQALIDDRAQALAQGYAVVGLDAAISAALRPLLGILEPRILTVLAGILGNLLPPLAVTTHEGGTLASGGTGGGGGGGETSGGGGTGGGGGGGGGGGETEGGAGGGGGGGETDGGGGGTDGLEKEFPGQGKHLGWAHKPPKHGWHYGQRKRP